MLLSKKEGKRKHPYAPLAVFTIAAASVINVTRKMKRFVKNKAEAVGDLFKHKMG